MSSIKKAVIPVAGLGTRFLPATISVPKELLPVVDKPIIQYIVEEMVAAGVEEIIFVDSPGKKAIYNHFHPSAELIDALKAAGKDELLRSVEHVRDLAKITTVVQEKPLGNGHALLQAKELIGSEPFAFAYGDDIIKSETGAIAQMLETYDKYQKTVMGVVEVDDEGTKMYGIIKPKQIDDVTYEILETVEKPGPENAPSHLANPGRYIFTPNIFEMLEQIEPGKGGELWLADAVERLGQSEPVYARKLEGVYYDCGSKIGFLKANLAYGLDRADLKEHLTEFINTVE